MEPTITLLGMPWPAYIAISCIAAFIITYRAARHGKIDVSIAETIGASLLWWLTLPMILAVILAQIVNDKRGRW